MHFFHFLVSIFLTLSLFSCSVQKSKRNLRSEGLPAESESEKTKAIVKDGDREIAISEDRVFSLLDEIDVFEFISEESDLQEIIKTFAQKFEILEKLDKNLSNHKTEISSICFLDKDNKKVTSKRYSLDYTQKVLIVELLPKEILVQDVDLISCSFIFHFLIGEGKYRKLAFIQLPIKMEMAEKKLSLFNRHTSYESDSSSEIIRSSEVDNFLLLHKEENSVDEIEFVCEDFISNNRFHITDLFSTPVFRFFYLANTNLPKSEKKCRIISYNKKRITGITGSFFVNFSDFRLSKKNLSEEEISKIELSFDNSSLFLIDNDKKFKSKKTFFELEEDQWLKSKAHYTMDGIFYLSNVPKDKRVRNSIEIRVKSICNNKEYNYFLPFRKEFSIVSILPKEFFQLNYPEFTYFGDKLSFVPRTEIKKSPVFLKQMAKNIQRCNFNIQLKSGNLEKDFSELNWMNIKRDKKGTEEEIKDVNSDIPLFWSKNGYGINLSHDKLKKGSPVSIEELEGMGDGMIQFIYLGLLNHDSYDLYDPYIPSNMKLYCKSPNNKILSLNIPIYEKLNFTPNVLNEDLLFSRNSVFLDFLSQNSISKCRILLYRGNVLSYYSTEIQIYKHSNLKGSKKWLFNSYPKDEERRMKTTKIERILKHY